MEFEEHGVKISKKLAYLCKPYRGCPRGSVGTPGGDTFDSEDIEEWEDCQIKGADDIFVCIPKPIYKCLIKYLSKR